MPKKQKTTYLDKALEIARSYHNVLSSYPKIYPNQTTVTQGDFSVSIGGFLSDEELKLPFQELAERLLTRAELPKRISENDKKILLEKKNEWVKQIKPLAGKFPEVYLGLKSELGLTYEADELLWWHVNRDMDGLLLKVQEVIKKMYELRCKELIKAERDEKVAGTGKEGMGDKNVNIGNIRDSTVLIQQADNEANQKITTNKRQDEKIGKDAGRVQEGIVAKIKSYLQYASPIIEFLKLIISIFKSSV